MKKISVVHYLSNLGLGGTEKTCQLFCDYLDKDKFDVSLVYLHPGLRLRDFESIDGLKAVRCQYENYIQDAVDSCRPDILHVYRSGYSEFPEPNMDIRVPHFVETNVFGFYDPNPAIDRTLFMSEWLQDYCLKRYNPRCKPEPGPFRFDYVNNPVEVPHNREKMEIARTWHDEGAIIVGRCGRPDNGIYHALNVNAVRLLRMQGYDIRFLVMAPPQNMINDLNEFDIPYFGIGPITDPEVLSRFYNSIDILAHARADGETFGVNIAEAMMHGKPVVTHIAEPSVPGMGVFQSQTTLVEDDATGFVCSNNAADYAIRLKLLVEDPELRERMGCTARMKATNEFEAGVCTSKLENIYKEIMLCKN